MEQPPYDGPDWSWVDSREAALAAYEREELDMLLLLPEEYGGTEDPRNVVFVPPGFVEIRDQILDEVLQFGQRVDEGLFNSFECYPEYHGACHVPVRLPIRAWHNERMGGEITAVLEIWQPISADG